MYEKKYWRDLNGVRHKAIKSKRAFNFRSPAHRKIREFVFKRANFTCQLCGVTSYDATPDYDGSGLPYVKDVNGNNVYLIVEHIKSRRCGGTNHPDNLQCACETCNKKKTKQDKIDYQDFLGNSRNSKSIAGAI